MEKGHHSSDYSKDVVQIGQVATKSILTPDTQSLSLSYYDAIVEQGPIPDHSDQTKPTLRHQEKQSHWQRVCTLLTTFLRSVGLTALATLIQSISVKDFSEPAKVAIHRDLVIALVRALVHIVPLAISLLEIILNTKAHYVGANFTRQTYLQFAAKAHELFIDASLSVLVLAYIRHQIALADGMPFGAFLGGLQFSQVSYLWSLEFWSALCSKTFTWKKKLMFLSIILPCALVAATAGPSSATLLLPRHGISLVGNSHFRINGKFEDIWPDHLSGDSISADCAVDSPDTSDSNWACPAQDWPTIQQGLSAFAADPRDFEDATHSQEWWFLLSNDSIFESISQSLLCTSSSADQFCASSAQELLASGIFAETNDWMISHPSNQSDFNDAYHGIEQGYYQPYAIVSCVADIIQGPDDDAFFRAARISETEEDLGNPREIYSVFNLTKSQVLDTVGNASKYRAFWFALPSSPFDPDALGVVIINPQDPSQVDTPTNITTCTIKAGWGTSTLRTDYSSFGQFQSTISSTPSSFPTYTFVSGDTNDQSDPNFADIKGFSYPQRRVLVDPTWAEYLNPAVVSSAADGTEIESSVINELMSSTSEAFDEAGVAKVLGILLTSGMGRTGVQLDYEIVPSTAAPCASNPSASCIDFTITHQILGWTYNLSGPGTKLSLTVILTYCLLACAHIGYVLFTGMSSSTWDSTAEVVALAMASRPTSHLKGTCAGIMGAGVFGVKVRIMGRRASEHHDEKNELRQICNGDKGMNRSDTLGHGEAEIAATYHFHTLSKRYGVIEIEPEDGQDGHHLVGNETTIAGETLSREDDETGHDASGEEDDEKVDLELIFGSPDNHEETWSLLEANTEYGQV
ncbi:hypothetical protein MMC25_004292 [Agyrium rufum]|nr:hypothetical protein [Agyrium rufum]